MFSLFKKRPVPWWQGAFIYQVYPRSFLDTNGDGIGDLPGITEKLDYIASLSADAIWISPFFKSPMKDFGYDVSDYHDVDPMFGTLADFDTLLARAHALNIKIIIDLVLNHTSDQHPWFTESRRDKTNAKADWYVWADAKADGGPPNNWVSLFGGPAWTLDETRGQYYMHNFLKEQPDLNFHNAEVQQEVLNTAEFWLNRGVDGLRLDVVNFYFHDKNLRDNPPRDPALGAATQFEGDDPYSRQQHVFDKSQPEMFSFLKKFRALMDRYKDRMTVGEIGDDDPYKLAALYTAGNDYLNTTYNPQMMAGASKELTASLIRKPIEEFLKHGTGWPSWAFSNHDVVRAASRWQAGGDGFGHNPRLSKMLVALLGCLYGTVFLYQGEELGLPEAMLKFEELQDPWGKHLWPKWQGRDGCRTPMPWNRKEYSGFSTVKPWLPIPDFHDRMDTAMQDIDRRSTLHFTRGFMQWRKTQPALQYGTIEFVDTGDEKLLEFRRVYKGEALICRFNLSEEDRDGLGPYDFSIENK